MPMLTIPPYVKERPEGLFDCAQITDLLIQPGQHRDSLYGQTRELLKASYLFPVAREARNKKAFLMTPDHIVIADVLLRMREFGIRGSSDSNADPFAAVSLALRHWSGGQPDWSEEKTPAQHVISDFAQDRHGWVFELWSFVHEKLGALVFDGRLHNVGRNMATHLRRGEERQWTPRGCFAIDLTDAMSHWHPRAKETREAMN